MMVLADLLGRRGLIWQGAMVIVMLLPFGTLSFAEAGANSPPELNTILMQSTYRIQGPKNDWLVWSHHNWAQRYIITISLRPLRLFLPVIL